MLPILIDYRHRIADNSYMYQRHLNLKKQMQKKSHFLLGPRATGKSWLIRNQLKEAQVFDLLDSDTFDRFLRRPAALGEEINNDLVVIDEIQKLPRLLDEVHRLIEKKAIRFLLTGSSARKLKSGGANLLAGRARSIHLYPLTHREITDFDMLKYCHRGGLPMIYDSDDYWTDLREYTQLYMREEIVNEAVVRKVDHFARFLDVFGQASGEELNFQQVASDSGVPVRTVANFVEVLKDTLLAFELLPFTHTKKRKAIVRSKILLFDVGVANYLAQRKSFAPASQDFGKAFEHFMLQEIRAYLGYHAPDCRMQYWRTSGVAYEVDCILDDQAAIEIKSFDRFQEKSLRGLKALKEEKKVKNYFLVSRDPVRRKVEGIEVLPYNEFLTSLWAGEIV